MQIYVHREGKQYGPFSIDQLRQYIEAGQLSPQDHAYYDGATEWVTVAKVLQLVREETGSARKTISPRGGAPATAATSSKYKAFISYSHQDKKWGDWLHKALETYRVPKGLVGKKTRHGAIPKRLFPIFRDREELPTSAELGEVINQALDDSSHLIVICSPRSAQSLWVNEEIKQFKRLGKSDQVLCLIVDGEPNAADKPELGQEECFPEAAKYQVGDDGELSTVQAEPIAADAREGKDGKRNALLKLVAGLIAVGFDDIKQRDLARKQKRLALLSSFSFGLAVVMAGLTFWALDQKAEGIRGRHAEAEQRMEAEKQRNKAETELQKTTLVSDFIQGVFTPLNSVEMAYINIGDLKVITQFINAGSQKLNNLKNKSDEEATFRNIFGKILLSLKIHEIARKELEKALSIRLQTLAPDHPDLADSYNQMGSTYTSSEPAKAIEYHQKALAIWLKIHGPEHPQVATTYKNLGKAFEEKNEPDKAIEYHEKALAIRLKVHGPEHPEVAAIYMDFGQAHAKMNEHDKAIEYHEMALATLLKVYGPEHSTVALSNLKLAEELKEQEKYGKAIDCFRKSLQIYQQFHGSDHASVAWCYGELGLCHDAAGEIERALECNEKALEILLKTRLAEHEMTANFYERIAKGLKKQGKFEEALENYQQALPIRVQVHGPEHVIVATVYAYIGQTYFKMSQFDKAIENLQQTLAILMKTFDPEHSSIAQAHYFIGVGYLQKKDYSKAREHLLKAKDVLLKIHGPEHKMVKDIQKKLNWLNGKQASPFPQRPRLP